MSRRSNRPRGGGRGRGSRFLRQASSGATDYLVEAENEEGVSKIMMEDPPINTDLMIYFLDDTQREIHLSSGPKTYWELQEIISKKFPAARNLFSILNDEKEFVTSENFKPSPKFVIREYFSPVSTSRYPLVPVKWDYKSYHAKPATFYDREEELLKEAKERQLKLIRDKEEEERLAQEFLTGPRDDGEADDPFDI